MFDKRKYSMCIDIEVILPIVEFLVEQKYMSWFVFTCFTQNEVHVKALL